MGICSTCEVAYKGERRFLLDSGASHNFMSPRFAPKVNSSSGYLTLADGSSKRFSGPIEMQAQVQDSSSFRSWLRTSGLTPFLACHGLLRCSLLSTGKIVS